LRVISFHLKAPYTGSTYSNHLFNIKIYTMSTGHIIKVTGLAAETSEEKLHDFFSFCGKLVSVKKDGSTAEIEFEKLSAMRTSL
jgi:hypothetical protein